jgi:molybdate transport system substrate-binding protein
MVELEKRGEVVPGTRRSPLSNSLVVVAPRDSNLRIVGPEDLASSAIRVLALAEPQSVPAGIYAKEYLERAGVWRALSERMVPTQNVRAALAAVESGNADAAIVYKTDAASSSKVKVVYQVPVGDAPRISYALAVMKRGKNRAGGQAFAAYLASPEAISVFERYGFAAPAP